MKTNLSLFAFTLLLSTELLPFIVSADNSEKGTNTEHSKSVQNSACNNLDFEDGNWNGWTGGYGYNTFSCSPLVITGNTINDGALNDPVPYCSYHTLIGNGYPADPFGGFPGVAPCGGSYAARLGGTDINVANYACGLPGQSATYSSGEYIQQTFAINTSNALFTYRFAVVLNDGGHLPDQAPYFKMEVVDTLGNAISTCGNYCIEYNNTIPPPGFIVSNINSLVSYLPWTTGVVDLTAFLGRTVTIKFTAAGCIYGSHFAYAYVDATCGLPSVSVTSNTLGCNNGFATLAAPCGASGAYQWIGPGIVGPDTTQTITVNAPGTYSVTVTPLYGCTFTVSVTVPGTIVNATTNSVNVLCHGGSTGQASVAMTGGVPPYTYSWSTTPVQTTATATNLQAGTYTVTVTDSNGCSVVSTATITEPSALVLADTTISPTCIGCTDGIIHLYPSGGIPGYVYSISPSAGTLSGNSFINLPADSFNVCVTDVNNCTTCDSVIVPPHSTGVQSLINNTEIFFSPNPAHNGATLNLNFTPVNAKLTIYDVVGKKIYEAAITSRKTFFPASIFPSHGLYMARFLNDGEVISPSKLLLIE